MIPPKKLILRGDLWIDVTRDEYMGFLTDNQMLSKISTKIVAIVDWIRIDILDILNLNDKVAEK
jgi:hypothetical protein